MVYCKEIHFPVMALLDALHEAGPGDPGLSSPEFWNVAQGIAGTRIDLWPLMSQQRERRIVDPKKYDFNEYVERQMKLLKIVGQTAGNPNADSAHYTRYADVWRQLVNGLRLRPEVAESMLLTTLFDYLMHDQHMHNLSYALGEEWNKPVSLEDARRWAVNNILDVQAVSTGNDVTITYQFACVKGSLPFVFSRSFAISQN